MFNKRVKVKDLLASETTGHEVTVMGWVRTFRNNQFIALNDGSTNNNIQIVAELGKFDEKLLKNTSHQSICMKFSTLRGQKFRYYISPDTKTVQIGHCFQGQTQGNFI